MRRALLHLTARQDAVFTAVAATVGGHQGMSLVPGASLLGWAAVRLYRELGVASFDAFHSGRVRFGDGFPATGDGQVAYPVPQSWHERKREKGGIADGRIVAEAVRNHAAGSDPFPEQVEPLRNAFVAPGGGIAMPARGYRMKTAIEPGGRRAAGAQLFGYSHTRPGTGFVALLEADDDPALAPIFDRLCRAFDGQHLTLGRSKSAEFGGLFDCRVQPDPPPMPWDGTASLGRSLTLWCLSDLCIEDARGAPCLTPSLDDLGLGLGALDAGRSFIVTRRYSSYNAHLRRRDMDRPVIAAGSVLSYAQGAVAGAVKRVAPGLGLYREAGLGRVWANPPLLASAVPDFRGAKAIVWRATDGRKEPGPADRRLAQWADEIASAAEDRRGREDAGAAWWSDLAPLLAALRSLRRPLPQPAQWSRVMDAASRARHDPEPLRRTLLEGRQAILKGSEWEQSVPIGGRQRSLRDWFSDRLAGDAGRGTPELVERVARKAKTEAQMTERGP